MSWILYDMANTIFSFNIVSLYYGLWLKDEFRLPDSVFALGNSLSMVVMFGLAPLLGALSDRARRRIPFLVASTLFCVLTTLPLGFVPWQTSIVLFALANLGFQSGLIFYDALLPSVSTPATRGRVGALGVAVGYLGSLVGLGVGGAILAGNETRDAYVFLATGFLFLGLALPSFFFVRERTRPVGSLRLSDVWHAGAHSFRALARLVRGHEHPDVRRFLLGRVFYTDAANTMIVFMGIYATFEVGFSAPDVRWLLLAGILGAALLAPLWGILVDRIGPKHTLDLVLLVWMFGLTVVLLLAVLDLPQAVFYPTAFLLGGALAGTWSADRPLMVALAPPARLGEFYGFYAMVGRFSAVVGPLLWALFVDGLGWGRPAAVASFIAFMLVAFLILRRLPDPRHPRTHPLGAFLPWRAPDGSPQPLPRRWFLKFPGHLTYAAVTTVLFWLFVQLYNRDRSAVPDGVFQFFVYEIPALFTEVPRTLLNFGTAVWANYHIVQLVYVFILLGLFGVWFEVREGTRRAALVFYVSSITAGIVAGILLHILRGVWDLPWIDHAWNQAWTGGSAGAFGLMGAFAARARKPWLFLSLFVLWEFNVGWWYLRSYTPAFHYTALITGYLLTRYGLAPRSPPASRPTRARASRSEAY